MSLKGVDMNKSLCETINAQTPDEYHYGWEPEEYLACAHAFIDKMGLRQQYLDFVQKEIRQLLSDDDYNSMIEKCKGLT